MHWPIMCCVAVSLGACASAKPAATPAPSAAPMRLERAPTPAPEADFEVISGVGTLSSEQVLATVAPELGALMACVQAQAQDAPWLGGDIELQWDIEPSGAVARVVARKSTLGSWPSEACILRRAAAMVFPQPKGGPATVALPVEMPAAKRPLVLDPLRARGTLVHGVSKLIKACGEVPEVYATAYVGETGRVLSVGFAAASPIDEAWAACAQAEVGHWVLTANRGYVSKLEFAIAP